MRSQKWDRQAVPFLGPCLSSFFEIFGIKVTEAQRFGFTEALWLMATEGQLFQLFMLVAYN